jgi:hypothetical protein
MEGRRGIVADESILQHEWRERELVFWCRLTGIS